MHNEIEPLSQIRKRGLICVNLLYEISVEHSYDLSAEAIDLTAELVIADARGYSVLLCPRSRVGVERSLGYVSEALGSLCLALHRALHEGYHLCAVDGIVHSEGTITDTVGYSVLSCPKDCLVIEGVSVGDVSKLGLRCLRLRASERSPEEGHCLRSCAGCIGREVRFVNAVGDALLNRPVDGLLIVAVLGNVDELDLLKLRFDCYLSVRLNEGICAIVVLRELDFLVASILNCQLSKLVAGVRCCRNLYGLICRSLLRLKLYGAILSFCNGILNGCTRLR